ncbi:GNAT family N-acetyltransferase [Viridibacillus sp. FSL R5-0477]|uniref:Putative acetyltransferase n=1 Tax=Viridibacillus arenosi FSL R5-213 TaxID=1227360 RepID=W4F0H5_9BACL|nr:MULTISPECIES: GNAT family N-acetyltransferase [Viridibacillus]ETT86348.1 putative acetyltransferase [Viridibacillus arenosi FSL R5-213]OMC82646.1 N-acetyltransferase [Viridibacillus sp. FSL H7-0596]OMC91809.1 N-acetyltransferase [Viridibacillus arenosi]
MDIKIDDLSRDEVKALLEEHLQGMALNSPPESIHALTIEELKKTEITFWSAWEGGALIGCGALKELDAHHGEIKSMRTSSLYLRRGVAGRMLEHIIEEARHRNYKRLSLETGSMEAFEPAKKLYLKNGFQYCRPFSNYIEEPNSVFMTLEL